MAATQKTESAPFPQFAKIWSDFKVPDADAVIAAQQKNIQAFNRANKTAIEGWQAVAEKQVSLWQATAEKTGAMVQDVMTEQEPAAKFGKQAAFAKAVFADGLSSAREAQATVSKATSEAVEIVSKRWSEGLGEIASYAGGGGKTATKA